MKSNCGEKVIQHLEENFPDLLRLWQERSIKSEGIQQPKLKEHALQIFELVKLAISDLLTEERIRDAADNIAKNCLEENTNIGDFVYNTNAARSILVNFVLSQITHGQKLDLEQIKPIIERINRYFDRFCYHYVSKYYELKNLEWQEQNVFLTEAHKDRLSLLGQMSSSFVHEFRNPLTSVIGFIKLLKADHPELKYLDIIDHELDQLKFRITQFLHTSKVELPEKRKQKVNLNLLFDEILNFLYPSIVDGDVEVGTHFEHQIQVIANRDELKQVFLNILHNSIDAVKARDRPRKINIYGAIDESKVVVHISNNGPMIPARIRKIIFEPFYTTKELGTGIGLFVCKKIIEIHGGTIECSSDHQLTTFSIQLPLSSSALDETDKT